jgi:Tfp pilus assembly protein PilN
MIKVNLLPARKPKRAADPGSQHVLLGVGAIGVAGLAVFLLVDHPRRSQLSEIQAQNTDLQKEIADKKKQLVGYDKLKAAAADSKTRAASIDKLLAAKVIPAHVMQELGDLLTPGHIPTMSEKTTELTSPGARGDANKRFDLTWDPTHVWITSYTDNAGAFTLEGGAQAEGDVNQFAKRMAASVYFADVTPARGEAASDPSGIGYYKFTITGKVAY